MNDEALKTAFRVWDTNSKGFIDVKDIKEVLRKGYFNQNPEIAKSGDNILEDLYLESDKICFDDFKELMENFVEDEQMSQSLTFH